MGCGQSTDSDSEILIQPWGQREEAEDLRQKADVEADMMREMDQRADDCGWWSRMIGLDENYRKQASDHHNKMTHYNNQAANKHLAANNKRSGPNQLDVHGLHPHEATRAVNERMRQVDKLKVITGRGLHSPDGIAKVKPAIEKDLRDRGNKVEHDRRNPGVVIASRSNGHRSASSHSNGQRNASTGGGGRSNASGGAKRGGK